MYYNEMMLAYIGSDVRKVGLSTKEKAKKYVKSKRIGIIDHIACVPRVFSLRKGRIADCLASIFRGLLGLALSRLTRRVVIIPE